MHRPADDASALLGIPTAIGLLAPIAGLAAVAAGLVVIVGWFSGSGTLVQLGLGGSAMKLSTAASIAAVGGALVLMAAGRGRRTASVLCGVVLVLTLGALVDWAFTTSLGVQRLFPASPVRTTSAAHVVPHTAIVLALLAGALLTLRSNRPRLHRVLVCFALAGTLLSAIGYAYGASTPGTISAFTGMTLPALLTATLLCFGLAALGVTRGLKLTLVHRGTAGQLTRRLLPAALVVPAVLGALALVGENAGVYSARTGFALFAWAMAVAFSALVLSLTFTLREREEAQAGAEAETLQAHADIDRFFRLSLDAMIIANADGHYVRVNPSFARMLGYSVEELVGRKITDLIHPDDLARSEDRFLKLLAGSDVTRRENRYGCKDGSYRWILWTATGADERGLIYASGKDVTERREMEDRLRASEKQALEASRLKSEFVASMSHELRTPLNGVIGMTDLLRYTPLDPTQTAYVSALGASSEALLAVISDVLDFSKMEAGHLELDPTDFDLRDLIEEATLMLAGQAHAKGLEIGHWVDADVLSTVHADRARVRQILLNLLSNAVKFTDTGEVTLRVTPRADDQLYMAVTDTGLGIDREQAASLFEAFTQADQTTTRQYGGTGLGLAISRRLVDLMGGTIGAEPRDGGGSLFWFAAPMPAAIGPATKAPCRPDLEARRILLVEDNATNRTILEYYLRSWKVACESVDRPSAAIAALEHAADQGQPFELAVVDLHLSQMDGIGLVREIRGRPALGALKVVMLSSAPLKRSRLDGIGVAATLTKPARQGDIYQAITDALAGRSPRELPAPAAQDVAIGNGQLVLLAEDNEINRTLAEALLDALGLRTASAHDGREATAMALAGDYAAILMDCQMPEVDGFEATGQIRAAESESESDRHVPIIAMTALSLPGDRERCLAAGMDDYVSKPIRREALVAALERCLPDTEFAEPAADPDHESEPDADADVTGSVLDMPTVQRLRDALTPEKYRTLLDTFDMQQKTCVAEIDVAIRSGDRTEVRRVAHKLKGSSSSLGASRLRICCQALEHVDPDGELGEPQIVELRGTAAEASEALRYQLAH